MTINTVIVATVGLIVLYVGFFHLAFYLISKQDIKHLFFAFVCLSVALYDIISALFYSATSVESGIWLQRGQFSAIALMALSILLFFRMATNNRLYKRDIPLISIYIFYIIIPWFNGALLLTVENPALREISLFNHTIVYYEASPGIILLLELLFVFLGIILYFRLMIIKLIRKKERGTILLSISFGLFLTLASIDLISASKLINFIYLTEYGFFLLIIVMDYLLIDRFVYALNEDHRLNRILDKKIEVRVNEIEKLNEELFNKNRDLNDKNKILKQLSEKDGLTGLFNHTAFQLRVMRIATMAERHHFCISVIMVDIDDFKEINDSYGHQVGDKVLQELAEILDSNLRDYDIKSRKKIKGLKSESDQLIRAYDTAARFGGDEFSLLLPFCDENGVQSVVNRLIEKFSHIKVEGLKKEVTLSIGICASTPSDKVDTEKIIKLADQALYKSKKDGKNNSTLLEYKK